MRYSGLSGKVFPIHIKPKDDELFSSWLVRLSLAHGLTPRALSSILLPQRKASIWEKQDIDLRLGMDQRITNTMLDTLLVTLSERCAIPLSRVKETTLDEYDERLYNRLFVSKLYSWITPHELYPTTRAQRFGMQACPQCLAEDNVHYFRRRWRFAFVIACPHHKSLLIDRCPDCSAPIRFHQNAAYLTYTVGGKMTICYKCLFDLRNTKAQCPAEPEIIEFQEKLVQVAKQGFVKAKGFGATASGEYFEALHWILKISTHWHPVVSEIQKAIFAYYSLDSNLSNFPKEHSIESLEVSRRYELVRLLRRLLIDEPSTYLRSSCSRNLMHRVWLNKWRSTSFWCSGVINTKRAEHSVVGKPFNIKQADTQMNYSGKRLEGLTEAVKYPQQIRPDELKRAASQLFLDGISTLHIASILNVPRIETWEWIKERCKSAQPGHQSQRRGWGRR